MTSSTSSPTCLPSPTRESTTAHARLFTDTHWSVVLQAKASHEQRLEALSSLCKTYSKPLSLLIRNAGFSDHEIEDLLQDFFIHRILPEGSLKKVEPEKGKFRTYLCMLLSHYLNDEWDRRNAKKRRALANAERIDEMDPNINDKPARQYASPTPDTQHLIDREWARQVFKNATSRLEMECGALGKSLLFDLVSTYLHNDVENLSWDDVAAKIGMKPGAVRMAALRIKNRWKDLIREEVRQTVQSNDDLNDELRYLVSVMSS